MWIVQEFTECLNNLNDISDDSTEFIVGSAIGESIGDDVDWFE